MFTLVVLKMLGLSVLLVNLSRASLDSKVEVRNDFFYGYTNGIFHLLHNGAGRSDRDRRREVPANLNDLYLLENDALREDFGNCFSESTQDVQDGANLNASKKIHFEDVTETSGIIHKHKHRHPQKSDCAFDLVLNSPNNFTTRFYGEDCVAEKITGGAAAGDYNNDGLVDLFFTVYYGSSLLYRNNGDGTFTDVSMATGIGPAGNASGAGWVDVDSDGDLDLYVTTVGDLQHYLYINQGSYFTEEAGVRGISLKYPFLRKLAGYTPAFGDYDRDGYLDVLTSEWIMHSSSGTKVSATRLFRNLGKEKPGYFEDVTNSSGVNMDDKWNRIRNKYTAGTHTFGGSFTDYDNDGWPDIFMTGDFGQSQMFWNNRNGTFTECTTGCGIVGNEEAMGYTIGDFNRDGLLDFYLTSIFYTNVTCNIFTCNFGPRGNGLYLGKGARKFEYSTDTYNVRDTKWGWGVSFIDYNNDGQLDIAATNGFEIPTTTLDDDYYGGFENLEFFENQGLNKSMKEKAKELNLNYNGMGRGLLVLDYDNDGDEDLLVIGNVGKPKLFRNDGGNKRNNWIRIRVLHRCDNNKEKLCDSYGARVYVTSTDGTKQMSEVGSKSHFLGQSEIIQHFGISKSEEANITVHWPRFNKTTSLTDVPLNRVVKVIAPESNSSKTTIPYHDLKECKKLKISEITVQPSDGKVSINPDGRSVNYDLKDLTIVDVGVQYFQYSVKVNDTLTLYGNVTLDFRGKPRFFIPSCKNGTSIFRRKPILSDKRLFDGTSNNQRNLNWGSVGENLNRLTPPAYADNISEPSGACTRHHRLTNTCLYPKEFTGTGSTRPSAREISNKLMSQINDVISKRNLSDMTIHYGQFLSHDTDHSTPIPRFLFLQYQANQVFLPISIPKGDVHFDPYNTGEESMSFVRSLFNGCTGTYNPGKAAREQFNTLSAIIDGSMVYGVDLKRHNFLREHKNGRMKTGDNMLLPKNKIFLPNENPVHRPGQELFVAGDIRANVQPGLLAIHILFIREHNRLADNYVYENPAASDEEAFQHARKMLIAEIQAITYNEYLPAILGGKEKIPKYKGYNKSVNTAISNEFSTAAFRFGHSQVNSLIFRLQENGEPIEEGHALLRDVYFKPNRLEQEGGIDPVLRGSTTFPAQEIDLLMVDEMRNHLFPQDSASPGRSTAFDLASFNIQRGRDHGLADLNTVRKSLGLKAYTSFYEITSDRSTAKKLKELYRDINNIDLWVGGLAEDHLEGSELGGTFHAIMVEQFTRIRDGDRFWYQNILSEEDIMKVEETTFSKIIRMNSGFKKCPDDVFFSSSQCSDVKDHQCIPRRENNFSEQYKELEENYKEQKRLINILAVLAGTLGLIAVAAIFTFITFFKRTNKSNQINRKI